ncbi:DUF4435 domain-containing protein [Sphingosinicella microcystinivorans]|uniref:DUF4435 domain-containing protein n=1 Tax=Sphingosinicella microcystinivorans TaxID=335406 RepID=UPI0022F3D8A1|nr:AAA family ATPase [Sphingosinicella microcystinivorans]WBX83298.1 AAA family ATPase [Sphingosinicella microcystinivorans]
MAIDATVDVPTPTGPIPISIRSGASVVFIGANGAGKTRLGVYLDRHFTKGTVETHRIAAHRSLVLNPNVVPPNLEIAENRLRFGRDDDQPWHKEIGRWGQKPETILLKDFDHVLSALYAENNDVSVAFRRKALEDRESRHDPPAAKIDRLKAIWETVLPHRELVVLGGNVKTKTSDGHEYSASEMSDGERVIFYLIAQALLAKPDTLLIFDEPELHINKSILAKLWDQIEAARPDCAFLYITHDVDFAGSRHAATKYALRAYRKEPSEAWDIELVPENADMPDDVVATIIGSRRPVLFVEGDGGSLDSALYRRVYSTFTVIPVGSCDQVIHTVASFAAWPELHRVGCAGLVDADGRTDAEAVHLEAKGVYRLPVSEVENLLVLPEVFLAIAKALKFTDQDAQQKLANLRTFVLTAANRDIDAVCFRYTKRRVDAEMKKIGLTGTDAASLEAAFVAATASVNVQTIFADVKSVLSAAIAAQEFEKVLLYYDNKGLLAEAGRQLGYQQKALEEYIGRELRSDESPALCDALKSYLPTPTPRP